MVTTDPRPRNHELKELNQNQLRSLAGDMVKHLQNFGTERHRSDGQDIKDKEGNPAEIIATLDNETLVPLLDAIRCDPREVVIEGTLRYCDPYEVDGLERQASVSLTLGTAVEGTQLERYTYFDIDGIGIDDMTKGMVLSQPELNRDLEYDESQENLYEDLVTDEEERALTGIHAKAIREAL